MVSYGISSLYRLIIFDYLYFLLVPVLEESGVVLVQNVEQNVMQSGIHITRPSMA